jgi:hypothetical protein
LTERRKNWAEPSFFKEFDNRAGHPAFVIYYQQDVTVKWKNRYKSERRHQHHPQTQVRRLLDELIAEDAFIKDSA